MLDKNFIEKTSELIQKSQNIIILTHYNPDGDAIGSTLALQKYLALKNKESQIIVPNDFPKFLKFLPNSKKIIIAEYNFNKAKTLISNADLIFCLDFNISSRINDLETLLDQTKAPKILIDHHEEPGNFDLIYSDAKEPATCQMIFNFIEANKDIQLIDSEIANCIYTGIYTDTGGFRFKSTSSKTYEIASVLLKKGVKPCEIISNILDNNSKSKLILLANMLQKMEILTEHKVAILNLTRQEMIENAYQKGDTEGFVNYGLSIADIDVSIFLVEDLKNNFVKMSFRSKGNKDMNKFARMYFNGGGHKQASGGKSLLSIEETILKIKQILQNEKIPEFI